MDVDVDLSDVLSLCWSGVLSRWYSGVLSLCRSSLECRLSSTCCENSDGSGIRLRLIIPTLSDSRVLTGGGGGGKGVSIFERSNEVLGIILLVVGVCGVCVWEVDVWIGDARVAVAGGITFKGGRVLLGIKLGLFSLEESDSVSDGGEDVSSKSWFGLGSRYTGGCLCCLV